MTAMKFPHKVNLFIHIVSFLILPHINKAKYEIFFHSEHYNIKLTLMPDDNCDKKYKVCGRKNIYLF